MKKRIAFTLALLMAFSLVLFASCGKVTAYSLVSDAVAKNEALDSFDADVDIDMSVKVSGVTVDVPMGYQIKASGLAGENPVTSTTMSVTSMGATIETNAYIEGEWCYVTMLGQNMKTKMDESTEQYDGYSSIESVFKPLPEALLADVEITDNGDGTRSVSAAISDEEFAEIYQDFIDDMSASAGQEGAVLDLSVSNGKVDITVDGNGYVSVYKVSFEMNLKVESSGVSMDAKAPVEMAITFHNPGTAVTVTPPDGYQDFPEVPSSLLG